MSKNENKIKIKKSKTNLNINSFLVLILVFSFLYTHRPLSAPHPLVAFGRSIVRPPPCSNLLSAPDHHGSYLQWAHYKVWK
jgi:hypothetical protein